MQPWVQILVIVGAGKFLSLKSAFLLVDRAFSKGFAILFAAILFLSLRNHVLAWNRRRPQAALLISSPSPAETAVEPGGNHLPAEINIQPEQQERDDRNFLQIIVSGFCLPSRLQYLTHKPQECWVGQRQ